MSTPSLEIVEAPAVSVQDAGRKYWRAYGVPTGGAMDQESMRQANRLAGNQDDAPVLEIAFALVTLRVLAEVTIAITGADASSSHPLWKSLKVASGDTVRLRGARAGLWSYLALGGGVEAPSFLGSASVNQRAGIGRMFRPGDVICRQSDVQPGQIAGRFLSPDAIPDWNHSPSLTVWPGPEWMAFPDASRSRFLTGEWEISPQSDRTGYRLRGSTISGGSAGILSGPMLTGTIQVPPSGEPIVLMRDGPTVGGYARLASVSGPDLNLLAQCAPGTRVRFKINTP
ncbi:MAG: biotin-dependent carboxyltransferase family protein [Verrucomicrobia bacterium]|nr:biotin-dependent carboxyltransferase family protein [Verrucomicrobiota bacterium]